MNERKLFTYGRFFVDDIEIYDFVIERAKRRIAAKKENCMGFGSIFYIHSVVVSISTESYCHIWREDIVVPYVTTYAVTLRRDCYFIQNNSQKIALTRAF